MLDTGTIYVGKSDKYENLLLKYGNRHGLITGATGNGKTVTLQVLAEGFSSAGVPVFCSDIKGDLSGIAVAGKITDKLLERAKLTDITPAPQAFPTIFWDLFGKEGQQIRVTVDSVGPLLISRMLELNEIQSDVLGVVFKFAETKHRKLETLEDLRLFLNECCNDAKEISLTYGRVSTITLTAILRSLLVLDQQGGSNLFGKTTFSVADLMKKTPEGLGYISVLTADNLMQSPQFYAAFMLWMMSKLFEDLPEVGDLDKPKLVFFFDEAHLLFQDAPKMLLTKVEQVVRLIRSKGIGIYFVTQNPMDVPESVLAQLSNRIQHALRAYTPLEQKAVKAAADTFRPNPAFSTKDVITQLETGEALISFLEDKGIPSIVGRTIICPPSSQIGAITPAQRKAVMDASPLKKNILGLPTNPKKVGRTPSAIEHLNFLNRMFTEMVKGLNPLRSK